MAEMNNEVDDNIHCICEALCELKSLQDFLTNNSTKYFGLLLAKLVGTDTVPFLLLTKNGRFSHTNTEMNDEARTEEYFETSYFRIESVDKERRHAILSLLRPLNIVGEHTSKPEEVVKLVRTAIYIEVNLACIYAIQPLDTELLKRQIIIEPKW